MESRRPYRSTLRTEQAAGTRARILAAAAAEFARRGYAATSIPAIASAAGVSPETVKLQGAKHELLLAAFELTFAGREGDAPIADDADMQEALGDLATPAATVEFFADTVATFSARGAALWRAFTGAAQADDAVAAVYRDLMARRLADHRRVVELLDERGIVGTDTPHEVLAAELAHLASPEGYLLLVEDYGWSPEHYRRWLADAVLRAVAAAPGEPPLG